MNFLYLQTLTMNSHPRDVVAIIAQLNEPGTSECFYAHRLALHLYSQAFPDLLDEMSYQVTREITGNIIT
jgi:hypothetical protein